MKTVLRTLLYLALIVWLGAEIFFPVVAAITFMTLRADTHTAGTIVGQLLRILHGMGMVSGLVALALLALAPAWSIYKPRAVLAPIDVYKRQDLNHRLMCTCGCAQVLGECDHAGCPGSCLLYTSRCV